MYRGTFEHWLGSFDEALEEDIDDFSYSRDEPARIRGTHTYSAIAGEEGFPVDDVEEAASQVWAFIEKIDAAGKGSR